MEREMQTTATVRLTYEHGEDAGAVEALSHDAAYQAECVAALEALAHKHALAAGMSDNVRIVHAEIASFDHV